LKRIDLIKIFLEYNLNVTSDVLNYLIQKKLSENFLRENVIPNIPLDVPVLNLLDLKKLLDDQDQLLPLTDEKKRENETKREAADGHPKTNEIKEKIKDEKSSIQGKISRQPPKLVIQQEIPEKTSDKPNIETFRLLFQDRYKQLSNILFNNIKNSNFLLKRNLLPTEIPGNKNGIIIGMVQDTRVLHTNKFVIQLEDSQDETITNCVMVKDSVLFPEYRNILRDSVIGIEGVLPKDFNGGFITAFWGKEIIRPGFSSIVFTPTSTSYKILFLADFHFGSTFFSRNIFSKLVDFLTLTGLKSSVERIASDIDTIFIVGDLIEGVGRSTDQKDNLIHHSIQSQYSGLTKLLKRIPKDIELLIIPGEHDATQVALPQPAIDKKLAKELLALPNLKSYGNPLKLAIDTTNFLLFHGQSNEAIFPYHSLSKTSNPSVGIQNLLEYRHLCPEYGSTIPLALYNKDYLVIDEIPDVLVTGHTHKAFYQEYKGVKIISCGTFLRNEEKSLGILSILNTGTGNVDTFDLKTL
jgi:DNA polymerase II small subunit